MLLSPNYSYILPPFLVLLSVVYDDLSPSKQFYYMYLNRHPLDKNIIISTTHHALGFWANEILTKMCFGKMDHLK